MSTLGHTTLNFLSSFVFSYKSGLKHLASFSPTLANLFISTYAMHSMSLKVRVRYYNMHSMSLKIRVRYYNLCQPLGRKREALPIRYLVFLNLDIRQPTFLLRKIKIIYFRMFKETMMSIHFHVLTYVLLCRLQVGK